MGVPHNPKINTALPRKAQTKSPEKRGPLHRKRGVHSTENEGSTPKERDSRQREFKSEVILGRELQTKGEGR